MTQDSKIPIAYRKLPGNITDMSTIKWLIKQLKYLNMKKVKLVLDREFYTQNNINELYTNNYKFLIGVKLSLSFVKNEFDKYYNIMITHKNYDNCYSLYYHTSIIKWDYTKINNNKNKQTQQSKRLYLHLYYNEQRAIEEKHRFYKKLNLYSLLIYLKEELFL